jgi:hypothetical protein
MLSEPWLFKNQVNDVTHLCITNVGVVKTLTNVEKGQHWNQSSVQLSYESLLASLQLWVIGDHMGIFNGGNVYIWAPQVSKVKLPWNYPIGKVTM